MFERSRYRAGFFPSNNARGKDVLLFVIKRTYDIDLVEGVCRVADDQEDFIYGDEYLSGNDPFTSSIKFESELAPWKTAQDIVFIGKAYAPGGKPKSSWDVSFQVGAHKRTLRIFGPRKVKWVPPKKKGKGKKKRLEHQPPLIGKASAVKEVELSYENAYGGFATFFPDNPEAFRKAVDDAQASAKSKDEEQKKAAEEAKQKEEEKKKEEAAKEKAAQEKAAIESRFESGTKDMGSAPDVDLDVEMGSAQKKAGGGTIILDAAELAEARKREALVGEARLKAEAEQAEKGPVREAGGAIKIDSDALAELAAAATAEAEKRGKRKSTRIAGTQVLDLKKQGDHVLSTDTWIEEQKAHRRRLYEEWGVTPQKEVAWEEGDFPRIPCPSNPVGKGFAIGHSKESINGLEMPLIENPKQLIRAQDLPRDPTTLHLEQQPAPGFGFYCKSWFPRADFCGINSDEVEAYQHQMDKELVEKLDPEKKEDLAAIEVLMDRKAKILDPRFYNGAHPGLQVHDLKGGEAVHLTHLDADGKSYFCLPTDRPIVRFDRGRGWEPIEVGLDTLVIDREDTKVIMVWRGFLGYGGPEELGEYPIAEIDVLDFNPDSASNEHDAEEADRILNQTQALKLGEDEISEEENAAFESRIMQAGIGLGGVKESAKKHGQKSKDGAIHDGSDELVVLSDDEWIEEAKQRGMSEEEIAQAQQQKSERDAVQAKKEAMKKRVEAIKAEEAAKKKKGKAKKAKPKAPKKS